VQQIITAAEAAPVGLVQTVGWPVPNQLAVSAAFDFTGRSGNSGAVFWSTAVLNVTGAPPSGTDINASLWIDGVELVVPNGIRTQLELEPDSGVDDGVLTQFGWKTDLSPSAHTVELRCGVESLATPVVVTSMIMGLDLGLT
jgi:hypothetical protein